MNFFFLISILNCILINLVKSKNIEIENTVPEIKQINDFINNYNMTSIINLCDEGDLNECYDKCLGAIKTKNFVNLKEIDNTQNLLERQLKTEYNNILSEFWFYAGQIEYWGLIKKKPNLVDGFSKFIISAFYGNPKAYYKLYIILETDIYKLIIDTKDFEHLKNTNTVIGHNLNYIFNTTNTNFSKNFYPEDEYEKSSVAMQFLYSSAVYKYPSAMTTMAYKYYKGYGLPNSCNSALKFYKETAQYNVKHITSRKKPNYYEKVNLESYEYVAQKFSNEIVDMNHLIDYLKVEALNGQINYIQQLGQRYFYGQGIPQNFREAIYYFEMGSKMNDSESIYYLGESYLNGWGVEKNYSEAFRLFSQAMNQNYSKAWNSLGYMYYYGLGVEKNIKRAYDYFKISFSKGEDSDAYYNMATVLSEGNEDIQVDFSNAYKYSNFIAAKGHTFGTYWFSMLNQYQLGSVLNSCEITIEFFKQVAERNLSSKFKFETAFKFYKEGFQKISALIYMELAEEGYEYGQVNAGLIFKNYDIFLNSSFNKFLSFKYFKMAHKMRNTFATLMLADFYYYGFGDLKIDHAKARELYKKVIQSGSDNNFYLSHAYFSLGMMHHFGYDQEKNYTKALKYYNISTVYEPNAYYPEFLMKQHILLNTSNLTSIFKDKLFSFVNTIFSPGLSLYSLITFIVGYIIFFVSLKLQKN